MHAALSGSILYLQFYAKVWYIVPIEQQKFSEMAVFGDHIFFNNKSLLLKHTNASYSIIAKLVQETLHHASSYGATEKRLCGRVSK